MGVVINIKDFIEKDIMKQRASIFRENALKNLEVLKEYLGEYHTVGQPLNFMMTEDGNIFRQISEDEFFCDTTFQFLRF